VTRKLVSILVIAPFREDERMYPHLYDLLVNLRERYDEVIYIEDTLRYQQRIDIDRLQYQLDHTDLSDGRIALQNCLDEQVRILIGARNLFIEQLSRINFKNKSHLVLAIDDNAFNCAMEVFPAETVYWSFDPIGKDSLCRLYQGEFIEQLIRENSVKISCARAVIVQDADRGEHLQECLDAPIHKIMFVPVALNDSNFCRISSLKRMQVGSPFKIRVVQCGYIWTGRFSDELIKSYEQWPQNYELHVKGDIGLDIVHLIQNNGKYIHVSPVFHDNNTLPVMLSDYDVGFIGYRESDRNHQLIINASSQLVMYLRLGMPVICSGPGQLIEFVNRTKIGIGIESPGKLSRHDLTELAKSYRMYSSNARKLYEQQYNLGKIMKNDFFVWLEALMQAQVAN
jgi:hypothetical protein